MFKFARKGQEPSGAAVTASATLPSHAARRDLLQQISNFLLDHDLEISPGNLVLAQAICSGSNVGLSRTIADRQLAHEPVTQAWLDDVARNAAAIRDDPELAAAPLPGNLQLARGDAGRDNLAGPDIPGAFAALLEREYRAATAPLSIACCGVDGFTDITDTHGQDTADRVIQAIARVLQRVAGENGHVARHGAEAFVLLFRGLTAGQVRDELDAARDNFARRKLVDRKTRKAIGRVTFSGGVADVFACGDPRAGLRAAEDALGEAMEQGRNRIVIASNQA